MKRTYVPTRMRARRSARRIVSRRAALGRFVPILDDDRYAVGSEIEDWVDAQAQADSLRLPGSGDRRWH